jgi:hypothetical protein
MRILRDSGPADAAQLADRYLSPLHRAYRRLIGEGVAAGLFRDVDPQMFYFTVTGAIDRFFSARLVLRHCYGQVQMDELHRNYRAHTIEFVMAGILARGGEETAL